VFKKIFLIILAIALIAGGLFLYFFLKTGGGGGVVPEGIAPGGGVLESAQNLPDSNVFTEVEINPFERGYTNPFE